MKIKVPHYPYGFPSNKIPSLLDDKKIIYKSNLPVVIDLSYSSDFLPDIEHEQIIKVSEYASIKVCRDEDHEFTLTSTRDGYTLYELANAVVQSVSTQRGLRDVWYTYEMILADDEYDDVITLSQNANH